AGGGSIARCDPGGALAVGPESAGADPGPLCYGKGKDVTVTDAHLYLGRLDPDRFLGGKMRLDASRARKGIEKLAAELKLSPTAAAEGVLRVADQHMAGAIRLISLERGHDPRDFTLVCFGGAGAMHAFSLARVLDIPEILIPCDPGILSARGMVLADVVKDYARTVLLPGEDADKLGGHFSALEAQAQKDLGAEGFARIRLARFADMRYAGQSYEITVPLKGKRESRGALLARFHRMHEVRFATASPDRPVEIVTLRLRAAGPTKKPPLPAIAAGGKDARAARAGSCRMIFEGKSHRAALYERDLLRARDRFTGPALVTEFSATTVVPPGAACRVDKWGNLILRPGAGRGGR
ncbi:MAG: hydantoinase/oxoprolinase family protein, partial [bacterium]|nr:hydantoinase/oxoprolinase family protein [bacterium]